MLSKATHVRNPLTTHPSEWTSEVGKRWAERVSAGLPFRWSTGDSERTLEKKQKKRVFGFKEEVGTRTTGCETTWGFVGAFYIWFARVK